jgi:L-threonylcarbamoyladenylate synthase
MKTILLPANNPQSIVRALQVLKSGGLVAFPTDTVYGLAALAIDGTAVESIYTAKRRPVEKAIPILLAGIDDLSRVAISVPEMALTLAAHFWPGPLTLVLPRQPDLPEVISSTPTVGVRVPDHPAALALLQASGPLAVSSANLSGEPSPSTAQQVLEQLGGRIALILDGGTTPGGTPSTVVDCLALEPRILREGPISAMQIRLALSLET